MKAPHISLLRLFAMLLAASNCTMAHAETDVDSDRWWVRAGPAWVAFSEGASLTVMGNPVPGASATVDNNVAAVAEIGYRFTPKVSLGLTLGIPAATTLTATGTASAVGKIGNVKYGPAGLTVQYQFDDIVGFRPYVGVGATYLKIFSTEDVGVSNFRADNAWGAIFQVGTEYRLTRHIGLFIDVKKMILRTDASGTLGGAPVQARVRLDPLVLQTGLMFRF